MKKFKIEHLIILLVVLTIAKFTFSKGNYRFFPEFGDDKSSKNLKYYNTNINQIYKTIPVISDCNQGELNQSEKGKALQELNYIRAFHQLRAVSYDSTSDNLTSKSALITAANNQLTHKPPQNFKCWSDEGYKGSSTSNLFISNQFDTKLPDTEFIIDSLLTDEGVESLGHRRWLLAPFLKVVSYGRVDGKPLVESKSDNVTGATLRVIYDEQQNIENDNIEFVAYPYLNYPKKLFDKDWYLSFSVIYDRKSSFNNGNVDFSNVSVEVINEQGERLKINSIKSNNENFGLGNILQWKAEKIDYEKKYNVKISNLKVNNELKNYEYWFNVKND